MKHMFALSCCASLAAAFPAAMIEAAQKDPVLMERAADVLRKRATPPAPNGDLSQANAAAATFEPVPTFDAKAQYVDVSDGGPNPWVAPGPSDLRGPCPGLNAMANHGFLPHNGYATITQFIDATNSVVGMGPQLAGFLAVLGASIDGDGTAWSIGGTPGPGIGGPLASQGNGISGSHNKYESDVSPLRPDLYQYGNDYNVIISQAQQLFAITDGNIDLGDLTQFRAQRYVDQVANNNYFFNGPFTGVLVQPAAYTFIFRFMANHSEAAPIGELTHDIFNSWFSLSGSGSDVTWTPGHERIPDNWYKRAIAYPYDNEYFIADVGNAGSLYPMFFDIGGNTGTTNSFTGVNVEDLSGGVINGQSLSQNNNFACLAYQFAAQVKPDVGLGATTALSSAIDTVLGPFGCPQLSQIDRDQLSQFPGYQKSGVAPS